MTEPAIVAEPNETLAAAADRMRAHRIGSVVVVEHARPVGILTERDVLDAVAAGQDPDVELAADHLTPEAVVATPDWPLTDAARAMLAGGFRHLVVSDGGEVVGVLSVRDLLRVWSAAADAKAPAHA